MGERRKKPSAWSNPKLSKAIDTHLTECFTALEGKEFAECFVPCWKEVLQMQDSKIVQQFFAHLHKVFMDIEASVMCEFHQAGYKEIALTHLEVQKAKVFATRLQNRNDKDIARYFELLKPVAFEIMLKGEIEQDDIDDIDWESVIEEIQSRALENISKLSPEQLTGSALGIIRSTATYYLEELATSCESSVEYDPIFSLPSGVQPSEVLKIRMTKWQSAKPNEKCKCDFRKNLNQTKLNKLAVVPLSHPKSIVARNQLFAIIHLQQPSCISRKGCSEQMEKICNDIDCFINQLFSMSSKATSDDIVNVSMSFIEELIEEDLFKIATPFLVTLLHGTVTLSSICRNQAYQFLIEALTNLKTDGSISPFDKWFLQAFCEYISTQLELSSLPTTLINLTKHLFECKSKELVSEAADVVSSKTPTSCVLEPILRLYQSQIGLVPADSTTRSIIYFLNALISIKNEGINKVHLGTIMETVWQNSELSDVAAKVVASLLPQKYFDMVNCSRPLMIPPKEYDMDLYKCEKEIEEKVISNAMSFYEAALWYLDLMVNDQFIHHSHQKVLCLLKAAYYLTKASQTVHVDQNSMPFTFKNAITLLAYDASQLACTCLQPGTRNFALATAYQLTCLAANITDPLQHSCLDGRVACGLLRKLFHSSNFTFLLSQPMSLDDFWVAASSYITKVSSLAQHSYIEQLLKLPERLLPIRSALLHYQNLEICYLKGQYDTPEFSEKRMVSMSKFLSETKWTVDDVSRAMTASLIQRNDDGFMKLPGYLDEHLEIAELKGIIFNYNEDSPSIHIIYEPAKDGNGLLSYKDIIEVLHLNSDEASKIMFSLDPPNGTERYHPFMKKRCYPMKLQNTEFMQSLFHADYILKFLTTGVEVSAKPPFNLKPTQESLIKDLPDKLNFLCQPPYLRGRSHMAQHRFWIEVEEIFYDVDVTDSQAIYYIDKVKIQVKSRPMVITLNGNTVDAKHSEYGPHAQFALQLTDNYKELSNHFRIFARVKELSKLQFIVQKHHSHLRTLKHDSPRSFESFSREVNRLHSLYPITSDSDCCLWVPATFNNFVYGGFLCTPKSSHLDYFQRSGADQPASCGDAEAVEFADVHKFMRSMRVLEGVGGLKFDIRYQHKVDIAHSETELVCVKLGEVQTSKHSHENILPQTAFCQGDDNVQISEDHSLPNQYDHPSTLNKQCYHPCNKPDVELMHSKDVCTQDSLEAHKTLDDEKESLNGAVHVSQHSDDHLQVDSTAVTNKSICSATKPTSMPSSNLSDPTSPLIEKMHPHRGESIAKEVQSEKQSLMMSKNAYLLNEDQSSLETHTGNELKDVQSSSAMNPLASTITAESESDSGLQTHKLWNLYSTKPDFELHSKDTYTQDGQEVNKPLDDEKVSLNKAKHGSLPLDSHSHPQDDSAAVTNKSVGSASLPASMPSPNLSDPTSPVLKKMYPQRGECIAEEVQTDEQSIMISKNEHSSNEDLSRLETHTGNEMKEIQSLFAQPTSEVKDVNPLAPAMTVASKSHIGTQVENETEFVYKKDLEASRLSDNEKESLCDIEHATQPFDAYSDMQLKPTANSVGSAYESESEPSSMYKSSAHNPKSPQIFEKGYSQGGEGIAKEIPSNGLTSQKDYSLTTEDPLMCETHTDNEMMLSSTKPVSKAKDTTHLLNPDVTVASNSDSDPQINNESDLAQNIHVDKPVSKPVRSLDGQQDESSKSTSNCVNVSSSSVSSSVLPLEGEIFTHKDTFASASRDKISNQSQKDDEQSESQSNKSIDLDHENVTSGSEAVSDSELEAESQSDAEPAKSSSASEQESASTFVNFDVESVMSHAAKFQILFLKGGKKQDTLSNVFSKSLVNQIVFGKSLNDPELRAMLMTTFNFNETSFHPNMLACHQIKTAIVLRKILELHYRHGTEQKIM